MQTQPHPPTKRTITTDMQPPTNSLISQNACIVRLRWPSSTLMSLIPIKVKDNFFLEYCCHFCCRNSLHWDILPDTDQCGRLLLFRCSSDSHTRTGTFLLLHWNLVREPGHQRGKGHTSTKCFAKIVQCSDVHFDCEASLLDYYILCQTFLSFLLPDSR